MSIKRVIQELQAKQAILRDFIDETTKELSNAIEEHNEISKQIKEAYEHAAE